MTKYYCEKGGHLLVDTEVRECAPCADLSREVAYDVPVENLCLSVRAYNVLFYKGIRTVGQLLDKTSRELWMIKGCGRKTVQEIEKTLAVLGLKLNGPSLHGETGSTKTIFRELIAMARSGALDPIVKAVLDAYENRKCEATAQAERV